LSFAAGVSQPASAAEGNTDPVLGRMEPGESYQVDELSALTGMTPAELLPRLTALELEGQVVMGGGRYTRARRG
jgi:predicted Rossmann fold nucleotide-binding protein DprA/Smf involved in DNA uptake